MVTRISSITLSVCIAIFATTVDRAAGIPLTNAGFEDPAAGKIVGFDAGTDVPGWSDAGSNADSGVEGPNPSWGTHSGTYAAFFMDGDPGAYQMTGYSIETGDVFTVGFWVNNIYGASGLTVTLFGDNVAVPANELGSYTASGLSGTFSYYEAVIAAPGASAGRELGLRFENTGGGWTGLDDITLSVSTNPISPAVQPVSHRPATEPLMTHDLSGTWDFTPLGQALTSIQVPGGGWYKQGFTTVEEADYETTIAIPDAGEPQVTILEFGAVNYEAILYVDGLVVGTNVQAYTPAFWDISGYVTPGGSHDIRLRVKGMGARMSGGRSLDPNGAGSWADFLPQGIFRSAELKIYPEVFISDVFVRTSVKNTELYYDVWLRNSSTHTTNVTLSGTLTSWNGDLWSYPSLPSQPVTLPAVAVTNVTIGPVSWGLGADSYWWPNVPYQNGYQARLHNLNLSLAPTGGGMAVHTNSTRFGFRECTQESDGTNTCYFLNGIRVNFRGDSLQGANYDRINNSGVGNAFDTYPGFLPGTNGWPRAVDNYQRLNYNVVRIHQIPASPYMLDVCDEMGLMIINETGIRGSGDQQDFTAGHDNMVSHVKALFTRDRNHASVLRLSIANEPDWSGSAGDAAGAVQFIEDLYDAAMEVDQTRPVSIDTGAGDYNEITHSNFSVFPHYGLNHNDWGNYTDEVYARSDRPYGCGEFIWDADNTAQGFTWFATASQAMRAKGASDTRPYTLLSAWASVIPGTETGDMQLENPPWNPTPLYPLYGEDNLPDPWSHPQIQRVQAAFHPVLVADADYWESIKLSNSSGDWPAAVPFLTPNSSITRTLHIYNDTFSGTDVDVFWELRVGAPDGAVADSGVVNATVPMGYIHAADLSFTPPYVTNGTSLYMVLRSEKDGVVMFQEEDQQFQMLNAVKLSGSAFGTSPSWSPGTEFDKATDGDLSTFFDYEVANGGYTGIDLGVGNASKVSYIVFTPRSGFEDRMVGGEFQGSNNGSSYTTIHTITVEPVGTTRVLVNTGTAYRYLRYMGPNGSYCNIAEMEFYSELLDPAETWRLINFGTIDNSGDAADHADPDGDDVINLFERAGGGDPHVADAHLQPGFDPMAPCLSISYRQAGGAADLAFDVHECSNLLSNSWTSAVGTNTILSDNGIIRSNRFTAPVDDTNKFLRVRVQ